MGGFLVEGVSGRSRSNAEAIVARRDAEALTIAFGEMGMGAEARGDRDLDDRRSGIEKHQAGTSQANVPIVLGRRHAGVMAERAVELAARQSGPTGKAIDAERRVEIAFHGG